MEAVFPIVESISSASDAQESRLSISSLSKLDDLFEDVKKHQFLSAESETASTRADDTYSMKSLSGLSQYSKSPRAANKNESSKELDLTITLKDLIVKRKYTRRNKVNDENDAALKAKPAKKVKKAVESTAAQKEETTATSEPQFPTLILKDGKPVLLCQSNIGVKKELVTVTKQNKLTTSQSFKASSHTEKWTEAETRKFFRAVEIFGTDFSMIATLFPERNRIQIKNKYSKEERCNPQLISKSFTRTKRSLKIFKRIGSLRTNLSLQEQQTDSTNDTSRTRTESFCSMASTDSLDRQIINDMTLFLSGTREQIC